MNRSSIPSEILLAMRNDYINNNMTQKELSKKYNISPSTIAEISKREKWTSNIKSIALKAHAKMDKEAVKRATKTLEDVYTAADMLLDAILTGSPKVMDDFKSDDPTTHRNGAQAANALSRALKDIKEIKMLRSALDEREQEARIKKLEKESVTDDAEKTITVIFADSDSEGFGD